MIAANLQAECDLAPKKLRVVFFSGYDGQRFYRVRVMWPGWSGLRQGTQDQVLEVLDQMRFGQP